MQVNRAFKAPQWIYETGRVLPWFLQRKKPKLLVTSMDLANDNAIQGLFDTKPVFYSRLFPLKGRYILGWGQKMSGRRALALKTQAEQGCLIVEDGFLRSSQRQGASCSLVIDRDGIFYDPKSPSRLFTLIPEPLDAVQIDRARAIMQSWRDASVSKYNDSPEFTEALPEKYVLLIDQVANDLSVKKASQGTPDFQRMLKAALDENPDCQVIIKAHPDSAKDPSKSHFSWNLGADNPRITVIRDRCHISKLLQDAKMVYVVSSQVGFEALIWNVPVRCFGAPFYAGWGLTQDSSAMSSPERPSATLEQLIFATLVKYTRYWNPISQTECEVEDVIRLLGANRKFYERPQIRTYALGFSRWKRGFIRDFLGNEDVRFVKEWADIPQGGNVVVWGARAIPETREDLKVRRIEDGFIRSSGLGADLVKPQSLVIDDVGIYFDATRPSGLEAIISNSDYTADDLALARAIRTDLIESRVNKYNLGGTNWTRPVTDKRVLLVVGQVEGDASIRYGSPNIKTNLDLLKCVRQNNPDAFLVYKPHPDVVAGLRASDSTTDLDSENICDEIVVDTDPVTMIDAVDEIHTITSLLGFEALIRAKPVVCYGQPFYSGWGLTTDVVHNPNRSRTVTIDELVHSVIVTYPRYYSSKAKMFIPADFAIQEMTKIAKLGPKTLTWNRRVLRQVLATYNVLLGKA